MATPYWKYPGVLEGRILSSNSTAGSGYSTGYAYVGYPYGYFGGTYTYTYAYGTYGSNTEHVFCLGEDQENAQTFRLRIGDTVSVQQAFIYNTPAHLVRFVFHGRVDASIPSPSDITVGGSVSFVAGASSLVPGNVGLCDVGDGMTGVILHTYGATGVGFTATSQERRITISGATDADNNGLHRFVAVPPVGMGVSDGASYGIIDNLTTVDHAMVQRLVDPSPVTIRLHGAQWSFHMDVEDGSGGGWVTRISHVEWLDHNHVRVTMALPVHRVPLGTVLAVRAVATLEDVP